MAERPPQARPRQAGGDAWFYFGHSGYEYIDLGRAWQIGSYVGLFLWFGLVARAIWPALRQRDERRPLVLLFALSALAIAGFYGAALGYGKHTHLAIAEYWRWWVVHLWVEGFFEVFATVAVAFLFARLGLLGLRATQRALLLSSTIFLASGIIGTLHHIYYAGTPEIVQALGSVFSALEVVPLVFIGHEAWENYRLIGQAPWMTRYRWPIYFFMAVAFWNLVGAGLFGFLINPPASLYYVQGLNTTPLHGHTALFGVYGMLGIALMLFCLRAVGPAAVWREGTLRAAFWLLNGGLLAMALLSLLPIGVLQARASIDVGYWYARSPEFLQSGPMNTLRWLRVVGDVAFAAGALVLAAFVAGLATGPLDTPASPRFRRRHAAKRAARRRLSAHGDATSRPDLGFRGSGPGVQGVWTWGSGGLDLGSGVWTWGSGGLDLGFRGSGPGVQGVWTSTRPASRACRPPDSGVPAPSPLCSEP